jgi:DNA-binding NarL/FixJ family response regulator
VRVIIADDHMLIRQGLIGLLGDVYPDGEFLQAGDLQDVEQELAAGPVDLLLIDLSMPGMNGAVTLRELREKHPKLLVAVLTGRDDHTTILSCLNAGVHGYILKIDALDQLLIAVRTILAGGVYVPAALSQIIYAAGVESLVESTQASGPPPATSSLGLTARQQEVLDLLAEGRSTKDIARCLSLGIGTVKVHLTGIYRALGARNRTDAVVKAAASRLKNPAEAVC